MPQYDEPKDYRLTVRITDSQALALDARALLSGVSRSDFVRGMIEKSWAARLAKAHRPYVPLASILLEISTKLGSIVDRSSFSNYDAQVLEKTAEKLNSVLDSLVDRLAHDQEVVFNADNEKETFE